VNNRVEPDHTRLSPEQISQGLLHSGISPEEFCRLWGCRRATLRRWMLATDHPDSLEPPYWVTGALAFTAMPGGLRQLRMLYDLNAIRGGA
jgi:hypothetical protein